MGAPAEPRRFLVIGPMRSGTSYVHSVLRAHPMVTCATNELATWPLFVLGADVFLSAGNDSGRRHTVTRAVFDGLCRRDQRPDARALGGKVALESPHDAFDLVLGLRELFEDLLIIRLHRDDCVARFASLVVAESSTRWWLAPGETRELEPQELPAGRFTEYVADDRRVSAALDELYHSHEVVDVRFDALGSPGWAEPVFAALGIEPAEVPPSRRSTPPVSTWVENLDELERIAAAVPAAGSAAEEIDEHRRGNLRCERPQLLLSRARHALAAGRGSAARRFAMTALWRPLPAHLLAQACELLGRILDEAGSARLAASTLSGLPQRVRDSEPFRALASRSDRVGAAAAAPNPSPHRGRHAPRRVLVVAPQWSGGTVVVRALDACDEVAMRIPEVRPWPLLHRGLEAFSARELDHAGRSSAVRAAFDALVPHTVGALARGLQLALPNDGDAIETVLGLKDHLDDVLVIWIRRPDLVACFADRALAEANPLWQRGASTAARDTGPRRRFDPAVFEVFAASQRRVAGCLEHLTTSHEVVQLDYDGDIATWSGFGTVVRALGLPREAIPRPRWQPPPRVDEVVENLDELRAIEAGTPAVDMTAELADCRRRAEAFEPPRVLVSRAEHCLRGNRPAEAEALCLKALRRAGSRGSPAADIGFVLLERVWRQLGDPTRAQRGIATLQSVHGDAVGLLCLHAAVLEAVGDAAAAAAIAQRAVERRAELRTTEFLRLRELIRRVGGEDP